MATTPAFKSDVETAKQLLSPLAREWDGKESVLALKAAKYNWKQMEWWAFYFEYLARQELRGEFKIPGERINTVTFDAKRSTNWDFKAKAIKSDEHKAILNDIVATDISIQRYGEHGAIIALCDVEYNDTNRTFQKWRAELEGGLSRYTKERALRTEASRYRKTRAELKEFLFVRFDSENVKLLGTMNQGRNSNGAPRPPKYMLDLEKLQPFLIDRIKIA